MFLRRLAVLAGNRSKTETAARETPDRDGPASEPLIARISKGDACLASVALRGVSVSESALHALLQLVAVALEGVRAQQAATRAEAVRESEEFKSTLLDAITHEFKTPLASIKIASWTILHDVADVPARIRESIAVIDEESDRLDLLVTDAVRMAQIDAASIELETRSLSVHDPRRPSAGGSVSASRWPVYGSACRRGAPRIVGGPGLGLDGAPASRRQQSLKYSPPGTPVEVSADARGANVLIRVRDHGPGIPAMERERIFPRFYRRRTNVAIGSGLGLYIAREIVRAHGGNLWVEACDAGSEFCMMLPAAEAV